MKAKEKKEKEIQLSEAPILFDATAQQTIPLTLTKNGKDFRLEHVLNPLQDERFFAYELAQERAIKRSSGLSTELYTVKHQLWLDLVEKRIGYKERADWKEATYQLDAVSCINALLHTEVVEPDADILDEEILFDEDELTEIQLRCLFSGALILTPHFFRQETKAEMDEFLATLAGEPSTTNLASAKKLSTAERLANLYDRVCQKQIGYKDNVVPAWHRSGAALQFFSNQLARLGK